jgi:hypothetical protein
MPPPDPAALARVDAAVAGLPEGPLRAALAALGRAALGRPAGTPLVRSALAGSTGGAVRP